MAQSVFPEGWVDPAVVENYVQLASERGLSLERVADDVEPESALLAAELRRLSAARERAVEAPAKPKGRSASARD